MIKALTIYILLVLLRYIWSTNGYDALLWLAGVIAIIGGAAFDEWYKRQLAALSAPNGEPSR